MDMVGKKRPIAIKNWLTDRRFHHLLVWVILFFLFLPLASSIFSNLLLFIFLVLVVYVNLNVLIPQYLPKNFFLYTTYLLGLCFLLAPINLALKNIISPGVIDLEGVMSIFLIYFFVAGSVTVIKITKDWLKTQKSSNEIEKTTIQTELKYLKAQINPHFLFNTLNNLYALTLKKSDKAPDIVIKLSEMLRYMLYECNEKRVPLSKEVKYIQNYIELEKLRQGEKANINFEIRGEIRDQKIAPFMFIPFLENSFKHGLNRGINDGFVNIRLNVGLDDVHFEIENNKPHMNLMPDSRKVGGIGLINVERRLNLIYPEAHKLRLQDSPDIYKVSLDLTLDNVI